MGILSRFKDIMSSNINAILDKMEDPAKMVDQLLRQMSEDLQNTKAETAGVMAEEARAKRELADCKEQIEKFDQYARRAVEAGNDKDALVFLEKKSGYNEKLTTLQAAYELAASNATKMRQLHDKLTEQINELTSRRESIKAKVKLAEAQKKANTLGESVNNSAAAMDAFSRMEQKADRLLDEANAMAELTEAKPDDAATLAKKYDEDKPKQSALEELEALKAEMSKDE